MNLADEMVADGQTPFCLGHRERADADGWPATDWVETVVLRTAGPDFYDQWIEARGAVRRSGGRQRHSHRRRDGAHARIPRHDSCPRPRSSLRRIALQDFVEKPGSCLMTPFPSFMPDVLGGARRQPVGTFGFPTFGLGHDDAVMGGGGIAVAVTDRPEVRQVMAALASADMGSRNGAAGVAARTAGQRYASTSRKMVNPVMGEIVEGIQAAIRSDEFRFDASDACPPRSGAARSSMGWCGCSGRAHSRTSISSRSTSPTTSKLPGVELERSD